MTLTDLKEKGLMESNFSNEKETIVAIVLTTGTEQIPHWKTDESVCGFARSISNAVGKSMAKEILGHQRPS